MKNSKNFSSYDDLINYYGSVENIPSNVLAVVEDQGSQVLFSVSNNLSQSGEQYPEGGYNLDEEDREKLDYSYSTVQEIELSYASKDYVADYVSQHGPDLTGYATESYVVGKIEDVVGVAPAALDTLKEIADSLNNDSDFAGTMTVALSNKADKSELNSYVSTSSLESMGYATQSYVVDYVATYAPQVDLTGYATESYVVNYVNTYGGGEDNVQADWNVTDSNSDSYILNKPKIINGTGNYSVIIGWTGNTASGTCSVAEGNGNMATGSGSHAEGEATRATGDNSHAEGSQNTTASGSMSHAEGKSTGAEQEAAHSEGVSTRAKGWGSHAEGIDNYAYNVGEHAEGYYNLSHTNGSAASTHWYSEATYTVHSIGIGNGPSDRKNALEIMQNGDLYAYSIGNYDGTNISTANTLAYVINNQEDRITYLENNQGGGSSVQADWDESDSTDPSYILNKPGDLVDVKMLNEVFSRNESRSETPITYTGQVVDYISYLDLASSSDLNDVVTWSSVPVICNTEAEYYTNESEQVFAVTFGNPSDYIEDENDIEDISLIIGNEYYKQINDTDYDCVVGLGMIRKSGRDESYSIPVVIDTFYEMPDTGKKSMAPVLKQTYKELATKDYVDSLIGNAASLAETIVGENDSNNNR